MAKHRRGKKGFMALKLDMSKAYDRIEWSYLATVLRKLGFPRNWIEMLMCYVSSVTFFLFLSTALPGDIYILHVVSAKGTHCLHISALKVSRIWLLKGKMEGKLQGVSIGGGAPSINHMWFVDDSLHFFWATSVECGQVSDILAEYAKVSGQMVNLQETRSRCPDTAVGGHGGGETWKIPWYANSGWEKQEGMFRLHQGTIVEAPPKLVGKTA